MMNQNECDFNKKGFTLIELLSTIVILSIVVGLTIYISLSVVNNSKEKSYLTTIQNIETSAANYLMEEQSNGEIEFIPVNDVSGDTVECQCVKIKNLIDKGYLDNDVLDSKVSQNKKVEQNDSIYVEKDSVTKAVTKTIYLPNEEYLSKCNAEVDDDEPSSSSKKSSSVAPSSKKSSSSSKKSSSVAPSSKKSSSSSKSSSKSSTPTAACYCCHCDKTKYSCNNLGTMTAKECQSNCDTFSWGTNLAGKSCGGGSSSSSKKSSSVAPSSKKSSSVAPSSKKSSSSSKKSSGGGSSSKGMCTPTQINRCDAQGKWTNPDTCACYSPPSSSVKSSSSSKKSSSSSKKSSSVASSSKKSSSAAPSSKKSSSSSKSSSKSSTPTAACYCCHCDKTKYSCNNLGTMTAKECQSNCDTFSWGTNLAGKSCGGGSSSSSRKSSSVAPSSKKSSSAAPSSKKSSSSSKKSSGGGSSSKGMCTPTQINRCDAQGKWTNPDTCACYSPPSSSVKSSSSSKKSSSSSKKSSSSSKKSSSSSKKSSSSSKKSSAKSSSKKSSAKSSSKKSSSKKASSKKTSCFLAGTKVLTIDGFVAIDKLKIGDMVVTYNEGTGNNEYQRVLNIGFFEPDTVDGELYTLKFDDDTSLKVTSSHKFYVKRNDEMLWIAAEDVRIGDLVMYANKKYHRVTDSTYEVLTQVVYNITVENAHNFYVGDQSILVHNTTIETMLVDGKRVFKATK